MLITNSNRKKYDEFIFLGKQMLIFRTAQNKKKSNHSFMVDQMTTHYYFWELVTELKLQSTIN